MIEYLKTSLSISSYSGCVVGCMYCILSSMKDSNVIKKDIEEEKLVEELFGNKYFVKDKTYITINNRTEPFLNENIKNSTFKILSLLEEKGLNNPILIITKWYLDDNDIQLLSKYNLNILIFYTYSGMDNKIEPVNNERQINTIKKLAKLKNITLIHYLRPVIEGVNTNDETIKEVSSISAKYFKHTVISGVRINSYLINKFKEVNIKIPFKTDVGHKVILKETYEKLKDEILKLDTSHNIYKKTSCAIANILKLKDININYLNPKMIEYCSKCGNYNICIEDKMNEDTIIKKELKKLGIEGEFNKIDNNNIFLEEDLSQEDISYIKHNLGIKASSNRIIKSPSEKILDN